MESNCNWLARLLDKDSRYLRQGIAVWLRAGITAEELEAYGRERFRERCRTLILDLRDWLRDGCRDEVAQSRRGLLSDRTAQLARSFFADYLKSEGHLDGVSPNRCREVYALLDRYFHGGSRTRVRTGT